MAESAGRAETSVRLIKLVSLVVCLVFLTDTVSSLDFGANLVNWPSFLKLFCLKLNKFWIYVITLLCYMLLPVCCISGHVQGSLSGNARSSCRISGGCYSHVGSEIMQKINACCQNSVLFFSVRNKDKTELIPSPDFWQKHNL